jgi:hypothetical protein
MTSLNDTNGRGPKLWGLMAQYETPQAIYPACERVRDAGYQDWDACVPFPVHGLDKAMGLKPTTLPWVVLAFGLAGCVFAISFEIWAMAYTMPIIVGGKPLFSIPAFVPVWYEFTVLSSCLTAFFGNWVFNRLPRLHHPAFQSAAFARVTDDKFFILIEATDAHFDLDKTRALLKDTGATLIEELED